MYLENSVSGMRCIDTGGRNWSTRLNVRLISRAYLCILLTAWLAWAEREWETILEEEKKRSAWLDPAWVNCISLHSSSKRFSSSGGGGGVGMHYAAYRDDRLSFLIWFCCCCHSDCSCFIDVSVSEEWRLTGSLLAYECCRCHLMTNDAHIPDSIGNLICQWLIDLMDIENEK